MQTVLIIEDDPQAIQVYQTKLPELNVELLVAQDGKAGLELAQSKVPDVIILDVMLPGGMNGFDILEQLQQDERTAGCKVIMLTNLSAEQDTAKAEGAVEYLVKAETPIDTILKIVAKHLR